jgi:hypothetical protein
LPDVQRRAPAVWPGAAVPSFAEWLLSLGAARPGALAAWCRQRAALRDVAEQPAAAPAALPAFVEPERAALPGAGRQRRAVPAESRGAARRSAAGVPLVDVESAFPPAVWRRRALRAAAAVRQRAVQGVLAESPPAAWARAVAGPGAVPAPVPVLARRAVARHPELARPGAVPVRPIAAAARLPASGAAQGCSGLVSDSPSCPH